VVSHIIPPSYEAKIFQFVVFYLSSPKHLFCQGSKVLQNDEFTKDLFRFLQLLCEGHNGGEVAFVCCRKLSLQRQTSFFLLFEYIYFLYCLMRKQWIISSPLLLSDFQNFLRTQTGNTTTVNIIISTVDYLLRLQVCNTQG